MDTAVGTRIEYVQVLLVPFCVQVPASAVDTGWGTSTAKRDGYSADRSMRGDRSMSRTSGAAAAVAAPVRSRRRTAATRCDADQDRSMLFIYFSPWPQPPTRRPYLARRKEQVLAFFDAGTAGAANHRDNFERRGQRNIGSSTRGCEQPEVQCLRDVDPLVLVNSRLGRSSRRLAVLPCFSGS